MTLPLVTGALAGLLLVLQQALMMTVGFHRFTTQTGVGFGADLELERLIRRHGNLAENAAIFLVTLGLLEAIGGSSTVVTAFAGIFLLGRIFHALGFSSLAGSHGGTHATGKPVFVLLRAVGAMSTALVGFLTGGYLAFVAITEISFGNLTALN